MFSPPSSSGLQIITATAYLAQPECPLHEPVLLSQIETAALAEQVLSQLQEQRSPHQSVTLLSGLDSSLTGLDFPLNTATPETWSYPALLYVPAIAPAVLTAFQQLIQVVAQLRSPEGGCPWDLAQTPQTLIPYVIEEAYEVVDAIRQNDPAAIAEELGDLLLQVVLQSQIASEQAQFSLGEVIQTITEKLIRRHPHVFGSVQVESIQEVKQNWEAIKANEKGTDTPESQPLSQKLSRYARTLPPLTGAMKISQKAAAVGFEWDSVEGVWDKFHEELRELREALATSNVEHQQSELGDLLFTVVNLARWYRLDPAEALQGTQERFIQRFALIEQVADRPLTSYTLVELEALWQQAKLQLAAKQQLQ